jgi:inosine/xanthosine triphosphatase
MKVVVGSKNPVKLNVTKAVYTDVFSNQSITFETFSAPSGVSDQPYGIEETKTGAYNRAHACLVEFPDATYGVGLEGGIEIIDESYFVTAWMCVLHQDGRVGFGRTSAFALPERINKLLADGMELGHACDEVFNAENSKQKGGAVGFLTDGEIPRSDFYADALRFALIPFVKQELYQ